jgi:dTDP-4-dehydrorhamnose 3,5-epimerase/CDP-3, 6-dideoxy-D-glycero-D-glycero-4-hexulose-5-epimerase
MIITETLFNNLYLIDYKSFKDDRGEFVKTIHKETFQENNLEWNFTESFFSISAKNVIRGMHFQYPPADHTKLVHVICGSILDVVLDLRSNSETYGKHYCVELSEQNRKGVYIGNGFAHGFLALESNSIVEYHTSTSQDKQSEGGIKWDTFGFRWPVVNPTISARDQAFFPLDLENTYFK